MKNILIALAILISTTVASAQFERDPILSKYQIQKLDKSTLDQIAFNFEIVAKTKTGFEVLVPINKQSRFLALAPDAQLLQADTTVDFANIGLWTNAYHNIDQVHAQLHKWAEQYPELAEVIQYGTSKQGRPLLALKISDGIAYDHPEPEIMLTAATHGDEIITTEIMLNLMEKLLTSYDKDERLTNIVAQHELYFIPTLNADGFANRQRYDNGADPNRSYPWPENPTAKPTPSIKAVMDFFHAHDFAASIDFHAYGELLMYPWAYTEEHVDAADAEMFQALVDKMAEQNKYTTGPIAETIYVAQGSSCDYYYWKNGTIALALEVGSQKAPNATQIPTYTLEQTESTWRFLENF